MPGEKTYEILVDGTWVEVTAEEWDRCGMYAQFPACLNQSGRTRP